MQTPIGLIHDLPINEYHAGPGISKTGLDAMARAPSIFHALHMNPKRPAREARAGQLEGHLAHCAILEPAEFARRYVSVPPDAPRTPSSAQWKAKNPSPESVKAMEWWRAFNANNDNATVITDEQRQVALAQAASVRSDPDIARLLSKGWAEVSAYWRDPVTGVLCRCRPDWVHPVDDKHVILVDIKTCGDATERDFSRQIARKNYHVQDRFYSDGFQMASGLRVVDFVFVAVESEWPYATGAYRLGEESRLEGFGIYRDLLDLYAHCLKTDTWPGIHSGIKQIEIPDYAFTSQEVEITYA